MDRLLYLLPKTLAEVAKDINHNKNMVGWLAGLGVVTWVLEGFIENKDLHHLAFLELLLQILVFLEESIHLTTFYFKSIMLYLSSSMLLAFLCSSCPDEIFFLRAFSSFCCLTSSCCFWAMIFFSRISLHFSYSSLSYVKI